MSKQQFYRFTKNEAGSSELYLEGVIASESWYDDKVSATQFREELEQHTGPITVRINSPGGDVYAGMQIYGMLKDRSSDVTIIVDALAASAASYIAMAGDKIIMNTGSMMMIHKASMMAWGNEDAMLEVADYLRKVDGNLLQIYAARTGKTEEEIKPLLAKETWFTADEAVEMGFADEATPGKTKLAQAVQNALGYNETVRAAALQPVTNLMERLKNEKEQVEEADATNTTQPVEEAVEQTVETDTTGEAEAQPTEAEEQVSEVEEIEVQEVTIPDTEETKQPVKEDKTAMTNKIAESQVMEPSAQAKVDAPVVNAKEWFKTKDAVEAFTMALANNPGKSFQDVEVQDAYKASQVTAGITDPSIFTLPEPVITSIEDAVKSGEIYSRMNHTGLDVFKLVWDDADSEIDTSRAGGFRPDVSRTKDQQVLDFDARVIRAQYIYKYLVLGKETIRENRSTGALVRFVLNELPVRIIRELERAAIIGDGRASGNKRKITSFVSVKADATAGNAFAETYVRAAGISLAEAVRRAATLIEAEGQIVLIAKKGFAVDAQFERNSLGDLLFPIGTSAAAVLGVDTIIEPTWFTDAADPDNDAYLVVLSKYMTVGDNSIEAFTNFKLETNENEFLQEIYKGGALAAVKAAVAISASVDS